METKDEQEKSENNQDKVIIHPAELRRRRDQLIEMVIFNEEVNQKVIQFPKNKK